MKKLLMFTMAMIVALSLMGCGFNKNKADKNDNANPPVEDNVNDQTPDENDDNLDDGGMNDDLNHNGESQMEVAEDAADKVNELDEVESATVIVTDRNAYVAVVMNNDTDNNEDSADEVPKELEDKIAEKVREADVDVDNVYVSLNPDFVERMNDYGQRINEGEPIEGFFEEFGEAVRNVFPDAR